MTREMTNRQIEELYPESDAATKRDLESLANAISQFRAAVSHIAAKRNDVPAAVQLEQARQRRHSVQRRVALEWAFATVAAAALLLPGAEYYRHHAAMARAQQEQALKQSEADAALLDQVASEISADVPVAMRPLDYTNDQDLTKQGEKNGGKDN